LNDNYLNTKIGIIGGGQLGKMMIQEAKKMGFSVAVLDPTENCPCASISDEQIIADFDNKQAINLLASMCDVITYEFEHIDYKALLELESKGYKVYPCAESLKIIQNKYTQKQKLVEGNIPVSEFKLINSIDDMFLFGEKFGYPFILKTCTGGYDGKGNAFVESIEEVQKSYNSLGSGSTLLMAEKFVAFTMETSVLACRGLNGDIVVYPVGNNKHINNILHETIVPANIPKNTKDTAMKLAYNVMELFDGIGMFCVEMFITEKNNVLVNEIAPRPHNSGHYTIEGCVTSQFENHIRAITGLPLGDTTLIRPTVMINLLGDENYKGKAIVTGLYEALKQKSIKVHIYGKEITSPRRKMGHITATAETIEEALTNAHNAFEKIKIISNKKINQ